MEFSFDTRISQDGEAAISVSQTSPVAERAAEAFRRAADLFVSQPEWGAFHREMLGVGGVIRQLFPSAEEMKAFEQSKEYGRLQQMVVQLRAKRGEQPDESLEPTRVITVRLPKSLHEALKTEADDLATSMNKLCISKLLQAIEESAIPQKSSAEERAKQMAELQAAIPSTSGE